MQVRIFHGFQIVCRIQVNHLMQSIECLSLAYLTKQLRIQLTVYLFQVIVQRLFCRIEIVVALVFAVRRNVMVGRFASRIRIC